MDPPVRSRRKLSGAGPARLVGYARAWDEIRDLARETEVFNFDKRALVLSIFDSASCAEATEKSPSPMSMRRSCGGLVPRAEAQSVSNSSCVSTR